MKDCKLKKSHYTYYSYEEFGRGYIGKRSCKCKPEEDVTYFGSYSDETFKPTQKIILGTYDTLEELAKAEEILHAFYDVAPNPHFANRHNAGENFYYVMTSEEASENAKKLWENMTPEQRSERAKKAHANMTPEQRSERTRKGQASLTPEQRSERARKREASKTPEQRSERSRKGQASLTPEQRSEIARKRNANMTLEQRSESLRKSLISYTSQKRSQTLRKTSSAKFQCTETGFITNAGNLAQYQRARGIDTSKRIRLS